VNPLSDARAVFCALLIALLPLAPVGLILLNAGLTRSRSAVHAVLGAVCLMCVAAISYFVVGYSWEGYAAAHSHTLRIGGAAWNWIATRPLFFRDISWTGAPESFAAVFQLFAVGMAAVIPWGSGAERWRLASACVTTVFLAGFIYPLFAHWAWAGGWLQQLGSTFHLGSGFVDPGGAATIQAVGGITALAAVWILGPRRGKFPSHSPPAALPAHHIIDTLLGSLLAFVGWLALNALAAMLFAATPLGRIPLVEMNTALCAAGALLASLVVTRILFGKPDASLCANGWTAGLVASSAVAAVLSPGGALFTGIVAGAFLPPVIGFLESRCRIDDPSGGITVHGLAAIWGLFAAGLLAAGAPGQLLAQMVGIGTLLGLMLPGIWILYLGLNRIVPFRTRPEGERVGMDLYELGAGAYPEFVLHSDDFPPR
jgi:Amt family ammonium transporter